MGPALAALRVRAGCTLPRPFRERGHVPITFQHWPWLLLLVPLLAWLLAVHRRSLADLSPGRRRAALGLRLVIVALLVAALAGATRVRLNHAQAVWFLLDLSESIAPESRQQALRAIDRAAAAMRRGDLAGVIAFGADALIEAPLANRPATSGKIASTPVTSYTDIGRALRLALAAFPEGSSRRVVLLSDGNENLGNAVEEAALAIAAGVPVDVVPIRQARAEEALLEQMLLPAEVKIGEPFELRLVASSDVAQEAVLRLYRNQAYVGDQQVTLAAGKNVFVFSQNLTKPGFYTYEARLEVARDGVPENNRALGFSLVRGRPRLLYVEGDPGQQQYLAAALRQQQIEADVANPTGIPRNLAEFQNYDSILLSNVSALSLSAQQMKLIQSNVRDLGQGFAMVGGDESFGAGGYFRTPIEETLPVDMDVTKQQVWPSTAVVCVIDKSSSMAMGGLGYSKIDLATEAAIAVAEVLGERDEFGVVCFDEAAKQVVRLQPVQNRQAAIQEQIATLVAGGGTNIYPGLMLAADWLRQSKARVKHCLLLTDGMSLPGDFVQATDALKGMKATLSTVAIGTDADQVLLRRLAAEGDGRFYYTDDPSALPRIFTKEALLVAKSLIIEEPFLPRVELAAEVLRGIDWDGVPPLLGYVATTPKALADVPLRTHRNDPLFAQWRYGLGRAVAFTSDCKARWGAQWLQWPGYQQFWGQAIRWTLRRSTRADFQTVVAVDRGRGKVLVDAIDEQGEFVNFLEVRANVVTPDMRPHSLTLRQTGPGRYEGEFPATAIGTYLVNVSRSDRRGTVSQTAGIALSYPPEYRDLKTNDFVLTRLAERTGGRVLRDPAEVFGKGRQPARTPVEIWPALLLAALLLFPLDVALRRVLIEPAEAWVWLKRHAARPHRRSEAPPVPASPATLGRLLERKSRVAVPRQEEAALPAAVATPPEDPGKRVAAPSPQSEAPPPPAAAKVAEADDADLSPTERLLRAKRRARGER